MGLVNYINEMSPMLKRLLAISVDFFLALVCFYLSLALRLGDLLPSKDGIAVFLFYVLIVGVTQAIIFNFTGLYKGIWRYSSTHDLIRIFKGVSFAVIISTMVLFLFNRLVNFPRSAIAIDWFLLIIALGGSRFSYRIWRDNISLKKNISDCKKVIIVGAGAAGEQLLREIKRDMSLNLFVVGFIDDGKELKGRLLHGVPILGKVNKLPEMIRKHMISKVYIAIPTATGKEIRRIIDTCRDIGVELKTLPKLSDLLQGQIDVTSLRHVGPSDLLGRKEIKLDENIIHKMLQHRCILVTGAGGSIGAELCRQIVKFEPKTLVLYDFSEFLIYDLIQNLSQLNSVTRVISVIGDVRNKEKLKTTFKSFSPEIVFHAAAYKHVPLMEAQPYEAVQTNIAGTKNVIDLSAEFNVERFVLVSTDKAVNPTNIMGATKRIAEIMVQDKIKNNPTMITKFMTTRFGNVLGSSGSVIPLFKKQIKTGGPITVTHPEVTRFFMTIPEATQLVLQAGAMGDGGEIFHFDMGESVKIVNLAKEMITLYGLKLGEDIDIVFTGLRPGEKLYEELLDDQEKVIPTEHPLVKKAYARSVEKLFVEKLQSLIETSPSEEKHIFVEKLAAIVSEYAYKENLPPVSADTKPHYQ